jgi:hypothetical protein
VDAGDVTGQVAGHGQGGAGGVAVVAPPGAAALGAAALGELHPHPPRPLDLVHVAVSAAGVVGVRVIGVGVGPAAVGVTAVGVVEVVGDVGAAEVVGGDVLVVAVVGVVEAGVVVGVGGSVVLGAGVGGERAHPGQVVGPIAQHPPERDDIAVEIVDRLQPGRPLRQQHGEAAGERLDVVLVRRQQHGDPRGERLLATEVRQRRRDGHRDHPCPGRGASGGLGAGPRAWFRGPRSPATRRAAPGRSRCTARRRHRG